MGLQKSLFEIADDIKLGAIPDSPASVSARNVLHSRLTTIAHVYGDILKVERGDCGVDWEHVYQIVDSL